MVASFKISSIPRLTPYPPMTADGKTYYIPYRRFSVKILDVWWFKAHTIETAK